MKFFCPPNYLLSLTVSALSFGSLTAQPLIEPPTASVQTLSDLRDVAERALQTFQVPGVAVGIVVGDQVILSQGYGVCDLHNKKPVTEHTVFPIASCSKAFTAFLLCQLADEGKVSLDDPVKKYLPDLALSDPEMTKSLTLRDLLSHQTGVARHDPIWYFSDVPRSKILSILQHLEPDCGLRQGFQYNNLMYSVAGMVIEKVTGQTWEQALEQRILSVLGMQDSNTSLEALGHSPQVAFPHAKIYDCVTQLPFRNAWTVNPGGGMNSSVADMTQWVRLQLAQGSRGEQQVIKSKTLQDSHKPQIVFPQAKGEIYHEGYALGWFVGQYRGHSYVSHAGHIDGFCSEVFLLPQDKLGLVILTNSSSEGEPVVTALRNTIVDRLLGISQEDWVAQLEKKCPKKIQQKSAPQVVLGEVSLKDYAGHYEHPAYGPITLRLEGDQILLSYGTLSIPLYYQSEDTFTGQLLPLCVYGVDPWISFTFFRNTEGDICQLEVPFEAFRASKPILFGRKGPSTEA